MTETFQLGKFKSKLPTTPTSIFSRMTGLANAHGAINLSQGFPDFETSPALIDLVSKAMREGFNQYAPMPGDLSLRTTIAKKYADFYGINIHEADEITITAGGTQGLFTVISTLIEKGDEVIIFEPAYDSYKPAIELFGGIAKPIQLRAPQFAIDWNEVRAAITTKTKLIIINNPNNPTGRIFKKNDIQELERIVEDFDLLLLSDEVYEHIVLDGNKHLTVLSSEILRQRAFVVCSFGKLLHTTGWKLGYVISIPYLTAEFRKVHQFNVFSVNTPIQVAISSYLDNMNYYEQIPTLFEDKRDFVASRLANSRFKVLPVEGTYFMLLDYSAISDLDELAFAEEVTIQHKVATVPVSAFYSNQENQNLLRICFAKKLETLTSATTALCNI